MRSKAGPAYRVLDTVEDYEKFLEHNDHSIIGRLFEGVFSMIECLFRQVISIVIRTH